MVHLVFRQIQVSLLKIMKKESGKDLENILRQGFVILYVVSGAERLQSQQLTLRFDGNCVELHTAELQSM